MGVASCSTQGPEPSRVECAACCLQRADHTRERHRTHTHAQLPNASPCPCRGGGKGRESRAGRACDERALAQYARTPATISCRCCVGPCPHVCGASAVPMQLHPSTYSPCLDLRCARFPRHTSVASLPPAKVAVASVPLLAKKARSIAMREGLACIACRACWRFFNGGMVLYMVCGFPVVAT
jgi:hypothetical protein